jgi:hypothetical protein
VTRRLTIGLVAFALLTGAGWSTADPAATGTSAPKPLRVATLNVLHGLSCPPDNNFCQAPDRAEIIANELEAQGCPQLVGFQEIGPAQKDGMPAAMARVCDGRYQLAWQPTDNPIDQEMVFTTLPIRDQGYLDIANFPWEAYWVRVKTPLGPVEFLTTHFASSSNNPPCAPDSCPPICPAGIETNQCHALEVVDFYDARPDATLQIASGDLNAPPGDPTVATFTDAGFVDAWLEAGRPECDAASGRGCTGGRERPANALDGLDAPEGRYSGRIDFVLVRAASGCRLGSRARPLFAEPLDEPFRGLYWPSDHAGVISTLRCR